MDRFVLEFGRFFWLWKGLAIYFIMTGIMLIAMVIMIKTDKGDKKVVKENKEGDEE